MPLDIQALPRVIQERQFLSMLKVVLERAYQDGISQFYNWKVDKGSISGAFRDGDKVFNFVLNGKGLTYSPAARKDSIESGIKSQRFDAVRADKQKKCKGTTTYACGGACLPNKKVCRINGRAIVTTKEMETLNKLGEGGSLSSSMGEPSSIAEEAQAPKPAAPGGKPPKKSLDEMSIRELRGEAQDRGVPGYSHVDKETLKAMVVAWDKEPEQQKRIVKVIEKRTKERESDPLKEFKRFFQLKKLLGPGSAITAAGILKVGLHVYGKVKDRYQGEFSTSANAAKERMGTIDVDNVPKSKEYVTFAIDKLGDHNTGTLAKSLEESDPKFFKKHHIVTIGSDAFEDGNKIKPNSVVPEPLRDGFEAYQSTSKRLSSAIIRGRDPQAIELAAQVLAYNKKYPGKQINMVGDHDGGMVVNEAAEIIRRANKDLAHNLRIVNIATPSFGLTEQVTNTKDGNEGKTLTVTSGRDPNNFFPKINNLQVNSVRGGKASDYLKDEHAKDVILGGLGYHDASQSAAPSRYKYNSKNTADPRHPDNAEWYESLSDKKKKETLSTWIDAETRANANVPKTPAAKRKAESDKLGEKAHENDTERRKKLGRSMARQKSQAQADADKRKAAEDAKKAEDAAKKKAKPPKNPPGINVQPIDPPKMPNRAPDAPRPRTSSSDSVIAAWNKANPDDQIGRGGKKPKREDSSDILSQSSAYREAFLLTAHRFERRE